MEGNSFFSASYYHPFGMLMPGRANPLNTVDSDGHWYGFQGQELDDEIKGLRGSSVNYKYRMHDPRVGRFFAVDPLAAKYPHNGPYNFSENDVIGALELEGLEKVSLAAEGNGKNYNDGDARAFKVRAERMEKYGYHSSVISTGQELLETLQNETSTHGAITRVIHFSHGGYLGMFMDWDEGFTTNAGGYGVGESRTIRDLYDKVEAGDIVFSTVTIWIMGSCNALSNGGTEKDFAYQITDEFGIITIAATGYVSPENVDGKPTGRLTTDGTFYKLEKIYTITNEHNEIISRFETQKAAEKEMSNMKDSSGLKIDSYIDKAPLGDTIDPSDF